MLNIIWGREHCDNFILDPRIWFARNKKPEWFETDFVKRILKDIDGTTVLFEEALKDYRGRGISTTMISTGCKSLCDIYFSDGIIFYGGGLGDNCIPYLLEIASQKDVTIVLEHYMDFDEDMFDSNLICHNGVPLDQDSYDDLYTDWAQSITDKGYEPDSRL